VAERQGRGQFGQAVRNLAHAFGRPRPAVRSRRIRLPLGETLRLEPHRLVEELPPSAFVEIKPDAFVGFIVDTWFGLKEFLAMKAKGELPADEPFMTSGFLKPDAKHIFDFEFAFVGAARSHLARLLGTPHFEHASISMIGPNGEYVAFAQYGKFYGRARIVFRAITWGSFED
jgi:hypothetical protein